jgi:hypothetical protein
MNASETGYKNVGRYFFCTILLDTLLQNEKGKCRYQTLYRIIVDLSSELRDVEMTRFCLFHQIQNCSKL